MKYVVTTYVSVDCIGSKNGRKVNFLQDVEGFSYYHQNEEVFRKGKHIADEISRIRARKTINELSKDFRAVSTKVLPSASLGWKNND